MTDQLREAGVIVGHLSRALLDGSRDLQAVPGLLKRIIREEMWRQWTDPSSGRAFGPFRSFAEFMMRPTSVGGLGSNEKQLRGLCVDDIEALDLLDRALQNRSGRPETVDNIHSKKPDGTSQDQALRKLRKDAPELHVDVLAGRLSAHAAMVQAGFRPRTITVPISRPEAVAKTLRKHLDPEDLALVIKLLTDPK